eukprot:gene1045-371_t
MSSMAAKSNSKSDIIARDLEELEEDITQSFFRKCSIDALKEYLVQLHCQDETLWTKYLDEFPVFTYPDLFSYFVDKPGYDKESLKAYKALTGYRLMEHRYALDLAAYNVPDTDFFFKFKVKPTQRSLTWNKRKHYEPWVIMKKDGEIISAHDECLGGYDGACRHIAAGLFEIEMSLRENTHKPSPTEGPCKWKKRRVYFRGRNSKNSREKAIIEATRVNFPNANCLPNFRCLWNIPCYSPSKDFNVSNEVEAESCGIKNRWTWKVDSAKKIAIKVALDEGQKFLESLRTLAQERKFLLKMKRLYATFSSEMEVADSDDELEEDFESTDDLFQTEDDNYSEINTEENDELY